jgi:ABC-2 type transport system permease protein
MNPVVAQLTLRGLLGRRRVLVLAALPVLLLLFSLVLRLTVGPSEELIESIIGGLALATMLPLLALIAGTGAIGPEIDDGSIMYLMAKPVSRHLIVRSKLVVAIVVVLAFASFPVFVSGLLLTQTSTSLVFGYTLSTALAGIAYCAVFLLLSVVTRNAVIIGLIYAIVWETIVGNFVPGAKTLSIMQWSLAFAEKVGGDQAVRMGVESEVSPLLGGILLLVVTVLATWYAGVRLRTLRLAGEE